MISIAIKRMACRALNRSVRARLAKEYSSRLKLSEAEAKQLQVEKLRALLIHAGRCVPYYRDMFRDAGFDPAGVDDISALSVLPVLTKDIIRKEGARILAEDFPPDDLQEKSTGGSTGEPLVFYRHAGYLEAAMLGTWRNFSLCGWEPGDPVAYFWGVNDPATYAWRSLKQELKLGYYTFDAFASGENAFVNWLDRLRLLRPVILYGYGSTIWQFCKWVESQGSALRMGGKLRGVFLTAEKLHDFQREQIERVLQVPVLDLYGSTEIQNIAFECREHSMHVAIDSVVVEAGDESLLLTSLDNYAMPFIRYQGGDVGELTASKCSCGIAFPCMSLNISRTCDTFRTESGRMIHGEFFTHLMEGVQGVKTFQFRQTSLRSVQVSVVADEGCTAETKQQMEAVAASVALRTGGELVAKLDWVDEIPLTPRGKHVFTISELGDDAV